ETLDDLAHATQVMDDVLRLEPVRRRLMANDRQVEVMLGYSDSAKEAGPLSATLALHDAQAALTTWARKNRVRLTLFHGRGEALWGPARGGPACDSMGVRLVADAAEPSGLVWHGKRAFGGAARRFAPRLRRMAALQRDAGQRRDEPRQDRPPDRRALPRAWRTLRPDGEGAWRVRPDERVGARGDWSSPPARGSEGSVVGDRAAQSIRR